MSLLLLNWITARQIHAEEVQPPTTAAHAQSNRPTDTVTTSGCVGRRGPNGPFYLSDISGGLYYLVGQLSGLSKHLEEGIKEKPEVRKAGGVYYTPAYIVDFIVNHTVALKIQGRSPAQLAGKEPFRVLDMACGSGSFLLSAYQCLLDYCLNWYIEHKPDNFKKAVYKDARKDQWRLKIEEKKRILTTHIFGVDIDLQAVEVSKLSLLLKVLEGETDQSLSLGQFTFNERALPNLASNIKRGNSLIASDFSIMPDHLIRVHAFDWEVGFKDIMKAGGFDVIIGNPPYVRPHKMTLEVKQYFWRNSRPLLQRQTSTLALWSEG